MDHVYYTLFSTILRLLAEGEDLELEDGPIDFEVAFDMEAEMEPINEVGYVIQCDDINMEELSKEDHEALARCKALRHVPQAINDLRPIDTSKLEYSYRPIESVIANYWGGPSYWKFRGSQKPPTTSAADPTKKTQRKPKNVKPIFGEKMDSVVFLESELPQSKTSAGKKKWVLKNVTLPDVPDYDETIFEHYSFGPKNNHFRANGQAATPADGLESGDDGEHFGDVSL